MGLITSVPQNVFFGFPNAVWVSASGTFRIVSDRPTCFGRIASFIEIEKLFVCSDEDIGCRRRAIGI